MVTSFCLRLLILISFPVFGCRFLVENVASMSWVDREEVTRHLKVNPLELDSQEITASKRRRLYWTNIPHPPRLPRLRDHPSTSLQSCIDGALALEQKCGVSFHIWTEYIDPHWCCMFCRVHYLTYYECLGRPLQQLVPGWYCQAGTCARRANQETTLH